MVADYVEKYSINKIERLKVEQAKICEEINTAMDNFSFEVKSTFASGMFALICAGMTGYFAVKLFQGDIAVESQNFAEALIVMSGFFSLFSAYETVLGVKNAKKKFSALNSKLVEKVGFDRLINNLEIGQVKAIAEVNKNGIGKER